jgi:ribosomal protein S18 acetylase RimI-like enzyme
MTGFRTFAEQERSDEFRVRRARPAEADRLLDLHRRALREAGTDPDDVPGARDVLWLEEAYLDTGGEFLVGEVDEQVVAMGGIVVDDTVGEVFRFAVDPDHQRRGYGSAVLGGLEAAARERGVSRVTLTTASRQEAAVSFYRTRGYAETERGRNGEYELVHFEKSLDG